MGEKIVIQSLHASSCHQAPYHSNSRSSKCMLANGRIGGGASYRIPKFYLRTQCRSNLPPITITCTHQLTKIRGGSHRDDGIVGRPWSCSLRMLFCPSFRESTTNVRVTGWSLLTTRSQFGFLLAQRSLQQYADGAFVDRADGGGGVFRIVSK